MTEPNKKMLRSDQAHPSTNGVYIMQDKCSRCKESVFYMESYGRYFCGCDEDGVGEITDLVFRYLNTKRK